MMFSTVYHNVRLHVLPVIKQFYQGPYCMFFWCIVKSFQTIEPHLSVSIKHEA